MIPQGLSLTFKALPDDGVNKTKTIAPHQCQRQHFLHHLPTHSTARSSLDFAAIQTEGESLYPALSADGRVVAFERVYYYSGR